MDLNNNKTEWTQFKVRFHLARKTDEIVAREEEKEEKMSDS